MIRRSTVRTTEAEIDGAIARSKQTSPVRIVLANYDRAHDEIVVVLSTKATLAIARSVVPGFSHIDPALLRDLTAQRSGLSIWSDKADVGVRLEQLLALTLGSKSSSVAAGVLGRKKSAAKAASSRTNGAKGGRPRAKPAAKKKVDA